MKKTLNAAAGFALGGILLFFTFRGRNMSEVWHSLSDADVALSMVSLLLLAIIFLLRAARWQLLLRETGAQVAFVDVVSALGLGYFVNGITPKLGEVARCLSLQRYSDVPLAQSFGSVVSERVYDLLVLVLGIVLVFITEMDRLGYLASQIMNRLSQLFGEHLLWYLVLGLSAAAILSIVMRKQLMQIGIIHKSLLFFDKLSHAVAQSFALRRYWLFIAYTVAIWASLILINYVFLLAMGIGSADMHFAVIVLFVSSIGWALPAPGGVGTSHFIVLQLFLAFGKAEESGLAFGIYSNGITLAFILIFGLIAVADYFWGSSWRKLRQ